MPSLTCHLLYTILYISYKHIKCQFYHHWVTLNICHTRFFPLAHWPLFEINIKYINWHMYHALCLFPCWFISLDSSHTPPFCHAQEHWLCSLICSLKSKMKIGANPKSAASHTVCECKNSSPTLPPLCPKRPTCRRCTTSKNLPK